MIQGASLIPHSPAPSLASARPRPLALRALGVLLLTIVLLPVYRLLAIPETGLAGAVTVQMADALREFSILIFLMALAVALLLARFWTALEQRLHRAGASLAALDRRAFALGAALFAGLAAFAFNALALRGQPNLIDTVSQLVHARYLAAGELAGPVTKGAFWHLQQTVVTPNGWLSQYPPGHVALLAAGMAAGVVEWVGPILLALTVLLTALIAERLLAHDRIAARLGVLLTAASAFLIAHAGAFMSHTSAAALSTLAIYCALRAEWRGRGLLWCGLALGGLLSVRPFTAITIGLLLTAFLFWSRQGWRATLQAVGLIVLGTLPAVALVAAYNAHFFGDPFRFGYQAALGPAGGLGFGVDPWGNSYGLREALAYTAAELTALNLNLLESPVPIVVLVAAFLLAGGALQLGDRFLVAWACLPLAANLFYWHHGLFMGPRMLNEYAPAWCLLAARGSTALTAQLRADRGYRGITPRGLLGSLLLVGCAGMLVLAPLRLTTLAVPESTVRAALAGVRAPALVFVHGGWAERVSMRLAAGGMRLDSVETALRQNSTCAVQAYADAREAGRPLPALDFEPRATGLPPRREIAPGSFVRIDESPIRPIACEREMLADRYGVVDPARWFVDSDLPGAPRNGIMIARDLGPSRNASLIAQHPDRTVFMLRADAANQRAVIEPYALAVAQLWPPPMLRQFRP